MKYHGAREGYDPKKLDDRRRSEGSLIPFPWKEEKEPRTDIDSKERRQKNYVRKHKRSLKTTKKKHGRSTH